MSDYGYSENDYPDIIENIMDKMNDIEPDDSERIETHFERDMRLFAQVEFRSGYIKTASGWDSI